jgi:hypothetical protein
MPVLDHVVKIRLTLEFFSHFSIAAAIQNLSNIFCFLTRLFSFGYMTWHNTVGRKNSSDT